MAPLTRATGPTGSAGFAPVNSSQPFPSNGHEVIELDDDSDEIVDDQAMDEDEGLDTNEDEDEDEDEGEEDEDEEMDETEDGEDESQDDYGDETNGLNGSESPLDLAPAPNGHKTLNAPAPELFTSAGAQEALHPLRRTADRVTRQIEAFADKLDRFKQQGSRADEFGSYQAAYQLVKNYQTIAQDAINDISKQSTLRRAKLGWNSNRANGSAHDPKTEEELQRLHLEANTWQLLLNLISINDPPSIASAKQAQETAFQKLHRYSSDREIWEQFLEADHYALECVIIMKWLELTAKSSAQDIDSVMTELEKQAERGEGLWTHGWLYTKEAIKGQKRLRAWPQPLEPNDPGIATSLLNSEKTEPLITQLDPDAITRQKHGLQKQDQYHERATWMACWKMLRQGEDWTRIREWAQARLENWRAVSLCGSSVDKKAHSERTPVDDSATRMMNCRSQNTWRAACSALARNQHAEDFERAVYGLLSGETEAAFKVSQNWDDYIYVYFNKVVLSRYQGFCKQFQRKLTYSPTTPVAFVPEPAGYGDVHKFVLYTKGNERVGVEARNPYRTIQAAIISKGYDNFFHSLAKAVSQAATTKSEITTFVPDLSPINVEDSLLIAAEDGDALRIATHLYVIANSLGNVRTDTQFSDVAAVNVIGYIANLEEAGLVDLIPSYASLLPRNMAHSVLGQVLIEVVDPQERKLLVRLMDKHAIDIEAVLQDQWNWISDSVSSVEHKRSRNTYPKVVIRKDGVRELAPVKKDLIGTDLSGADERIIRSLEWLRYVDGQWGRICHLGAQLYKQFYLSGKFAAARELTHRMGLSDVSRELFGFDVTEFPVNIIDGLDSIIEPTSPTKRLFGSHRRSRSATNGVPSSGETNILIQQSRLMRELEELVLGFEALEAFANTYDKIDKTKHRRDSGTIHDLREALQEALDEIAVHVDAVLDEWLTIAANGVDVTENEQAQLEEIRNTYIPELFLDYHAALYYSARVLTSDNLVQCMNLGIQLAENEFLTRCFVTSRRMRELVEALALSSKAMVNTGADPEKKLLGGESLGLWNVRVPQDGNLPGSD
ncbi:nucleoporin Nup84/Nup107 family protein [Aspergillus affinis]|uniref:nucleoporin Nup84/Nup107 family protein n=1 Tax=Aspergillus affinis TaxID=1070780 RepID=UPI0022FE29D7|nr:nuclear pore complex protein An-Nup84 [Aspergillus affinis]KAI9038731.1 nuclear pore complex protein An-Nup84 [Aspergillus affinis]